MSASAILRSALLSVIVVTTGAARAPRAQPQQPSPIGLWNTIDDDDGKPTAIVEISEVKSEVKGETRGELHGIVRAFLVPATHDDSVCTKCPGDRRGRPIIGMEILSHMRPDGDEWSGGAILDPENGKVYRARMKLTDGGRKLVVRGYVGFSFLGRSQTWVRR